MIIINKTEQELALRNIMRYVKSIFPEASDSYVHYHSYEFLVAAFPHLCVSQDMMEDSGPIVLYTSDVQTLQYLPLERVVTLIMPHVVMLELQKYIDGMPNLRELHIFGIQGGTRCHIELRDLTHLTLHGSSRWATYDIEGCISSLEYLSIIPRTHYSNVHIDLNMKNLRYLKIPHCQLKKISHQDHLELVHLDASHSYDVDRHNSLCRGQTEFTILDNPSTIKLGPITSPLIDILAITKVTHLEFQHNTDLWKVDMSAFSNLRILNIAFHRRLRSDSRLIIKGHSRIYSTLRHLKISFRELPDEFYDQIEFSRFKILKTLDIGMHDSMNLVERIKGLPSDPNGP